MISHLLRKKAWGGPLEKWNYREDREMLKKVWKGITGKLNELRSTMKVKGKPLSNFNLNQLFTSQDPEERRAGYQIRSAINQYVNESFDEATLNRFKANYGANVTDWLTQTVKASKKAKEKDFSIEADLSEDLDKISSLVTKKLDTVTASKVQNVIKQAKSKIGYLDKI